MNNELSIDINYEQKTYGDCLDSWLEMIKSGIKESTYVRYRSTIENHIKPELGNYIISNLTKKVVERYVSIKLTKGRIDHNGGLSPKTVTDQLYIIKNSLMYIQDSEHVKISNIDRIIIKKDYKEMRVLTKEEEKKLLTKLVFNIDLYKLGILLCLFSGIRIGELCALKWEDIALDDRYIKINKTLQRLPYAKKTPGRKTRIVVTEPKTLAALRYIPVSNYILKYLHQFKTSDNCFFLSGKAEVFIEPRTMQNRFKSYIKECGIQDANFHSLRHTFATRCIEAGFDIKTLSVILGHSSVKITMDRYVHISMEQKRYNIDKLEKYFVNYERI